MPHEMLIDRRLMDARQAEVVNDIVDLSGLMIEHIHFNAGLFGSVSDEAVVFGPSADALTLRLDRLPLLPGRPGWGRLVRAAFAPDFPACVDLRGQMWTPARPLR